MKEAKVVFLSRTDPAIRETFWEHVPHGFDVVWLEAKTATNNEIIEHLRDADFLLLTRARVPEQALREAKRLKLIQLFSQGYDGVPLDVTTELDIPVANVGGANTIAVAEHTMLLMLAVMRRLCPSVAAAREGKAAIDIDRRRYYQLYGKVVGLVGLGSIGRQVAKMVSGFSASVIFYDKTPIPQSVLNKVKAKPVGLNELLRTADVVSLHVPLLESTRHMMGAEQFNMMKPSAFLINTSRGEVVDEAALINALRQKKLAGAGLDVLTKEPTDRDNPLLSMDNVVATPHVGGYSWENFLTRFDDVWGNVISVWQGKPPRNVVTER